MFGTTRREGGQTHLTEEGASHPAGAAVYGGENEEYRYRLERSWAGGNRKRVLFVMLNPSTATEHDDDPTMRRCRGYAKAWGYSGFVVVNIFAYRATYPKDMKRAADPIGPQNDRFILNAHFESPLTVVAWGTHGTHKGRGQEVARMLIATGKPVHALGLCDNGHPRHPLMVRADAQLTPYFPPGEP